MRLIDADLLKEEINSSLNTGRETFSPEIICDAVDELPTAFDIDKVVEQIEYKWKHPDVPVMKLKMTNEEAIKELSYDDTAYGGSCTYEVRMEAIKALEKQIPKKVTNMKRILDFSGNYYTSKGNCPCCKEGLNRSFIYCNKCGQKLKWE